MKNEFIYWYIFRSYYFALKIIAVILNKTTQYISFVAITFFITFFLMVKQGLFIYEDIFINSLKGLYPEFITSSTSLSKKLSNNSEIDIKNEIFVHSEEIGFSYKGEDEITKFMNVRTYDKEYKSNLFDTISITETCNEQKNTIWISSRLFDNMAQDKIFDKQTLYFRDEDDQFIKYPVCKFELKNNEKWLLLSTNTAKSIAYMPFTKYVAYTKNRDIKENLYDTSDLNNWKQYIDYDDLGMFLMAKNISNTFLLAFFIFLIVFMVIAFSSLVKEFESSIFLTKLYGLNIYRTITLYTFFFIVYSIAISFFVFVEYNLFSYLIDVVSGFYVPIDFSLFSNIVWILVSIGFVVSVLMSIKYHRLPL